MSTGLAESSHAVTMCPGNGSIWPRNHPWVKWLFPHSLGMHDLKTEKLNRFNCFIKKMMIYKNKDTVTARIPLTQDEEEVLLIYKLQIKQDG